jgi:hypothetical protein
MGDFLTAASTLTCPHGGTVTAVPANEQVSLDGDPIVLATDAFTVEGCAFAPGGVPNPCVEVQWIVPAARSAADGAETLTTDSVGLCLADDGAPQGPVLIQDTQFVVSGL